ncbi:ABC transporter ATP-binding protein [Streptomyces angustmyceticus]|uniref:ABC transporter ATP-binding protein n=1 Tax=Streptomyces angustmyceticus TaxID=285578 RepID=UPI00344C091A
MLGKSVSGKSTLLRCLAGLVPPSSGTVSYRDTPLTGANPGTAMDFQTFALLPWLTVQQNVELGLETRGVPADGRADAARQAIDLIGLGDFESAYPKELSGGMRQRVGFARVIVLVTHNIEEAVLMADRIVVLGSRPYGTIRETIEAGLDRVYRIMTGRAKETRIPGRPQGADLDKRTPANTPLPTASVDGLSGLAEMVAHRGGRWTSPTSPTTSAWKSTTYYPGRHLGPARLRRDQRRRSGPH